MQYKREPESKIAPLLFGNYIVCPGSGPSRSQAGGKSIMQIAWGCCHNQPVRVTQINNQLTCNSVFPRFTVHCCLVTAFTRVGFTSAIIYFWLFTALWNGSLGVRGCYKYRPDVGVHVSSLIAQPTQSKLTGKLVANTFVRKVLRLQNIIHPLYQWYLPPIVKEG